MPERMTTPLPVGSLEITAPARPTDPTGDHPHFPDRRGMDRWEMVIPKMSRPPARPSRELVSERPQARPLAGDLSRPQGTHSAFQPEAEASDSGGLLSIAARQRSPQQSIPKHSIQESLEQAAAPEILGGLGVPVAQPAAPATQQLRNSRLWVMIAACSVALLVAGILLFALKQDLTNPRRPSPAVVETGPAVDVDPARWVTLSQSPRQINVVRDSMHLADFRMDFQGLADAKTTGWVFRVKDAKNYYAMSVEIAKPTAASSSAVVRRFAVVDGRDEPMTLTLVAIGFQPGAFYRVRTEARGNTFTTWIADRKVDEWTDSRLSGGGVGLYNDRFEAATMVADLEVFPLPGNRSQATGEPDQRKE